MRLLERFFFFLFFFVVFLVGGPGYPAVAPLNTSYSHHMGLKLATKKSYHPGKETNKARVARDEQREFESRDSKLESERLDRFCVLRQRAGLVDSVVEAKQGGKEAAVGSLQTFNKIVDSPERVNKWVNKMNPDLAKAKMDPLADMNRFLEETERWEAASEVGAGDKQRGNDSDRDIHAPRKRRLKRKRRSHRVTKDR